MENMEFVEKVYEGYVSLTDEELNKIEGGSLTLALGTAAGIAVGYMIGKRW